MVVERRRRVRSREVVENWESNPAPGRCRLRHHISCLLAVLTRRMGIGFVLFEVGIDVMRCGLVVGVSGLGAV